MDLYTSLSHLENYLSNTVEFLELKNAKQVIGSKPNINSLITNFKQKQNSIYYEKLSNTELTKIMDELEFDFTKLSKIPEINRYFNAVDRFNQIISNVMKELNTSLEFKLS